MAGVLSKGITLSYKIGDEGEYIALKNLQEIPELGGEAEAIEITTLEDAAHMYMNGILNYGDSLGFMFLYEKEQFKSLTAITQEASWQVKLPEGETCSFKGTCSCKLSGVGINSPLTYTLSIKPTSKMEWA